MNVKLYVFWGGNSNFVIRKKFCTPGSCIEFTSPKCDQVCKILCFLSGNSNFDIKNDFFVHLAAPDSHPDQGMKVTDLKIDHVSQILCF